MKRIYVAGAISSDNLEQSLQNIHKGIETGKELLLKGYAPFVPHLDFLYNIINDKKIDVDVYYQYDLEFLKCCDAMLICPNWVHSKGVKNEILLAHKYNIPIYFNILDLMEHIK